MRLVGILLLLTTSIQASSLNFGFSNPSFSGNGFSTHVLSVSQLEFNRSKDIDDKEAARVAKEIRDEENSIVNKFITNVESRIYATLSKQLVENMFGICSAEEVTANTCTVTTSGTATYMGATMVWSRDDTSNTITLQITQPDGTTTEIIVPIKGFGF
jgi:Na+-transporting NADH:ubiquinone oxidoreductase subunit NqrC|tara:strand:- start:112 stop:585 length:474 start_codon:yes stop_codon:yes gene_type:complete